MTRNSRGSQGLSVHDFADYGNGELRKYAPRGGAPKAMVGHWPYVSSILLRSRLASVVLLVSKTEVRNVAGQRKKRADKEQDKANKHAHPPRNGRQKGVPRHQGQFNWKGREGLAR